MSDVPRPVSIQNGAVASWKFLFHIGERKGPFLYSSGRFFPCPQGGTCLPLSKIEGDFKTKGINIFCSRSCWGLDTSNTIYYNNANDCGNDCTVRPYYNY